MSELSDTEREILAIAALSWRYSGVKEQAIRDRLDMSATSFYQRLNALIETEAALAADPVLVNRLRRLRELRRR